MKESKSTKKRILNFITAGAFLILIFVMAFLNFSEVMGGGKKTETIEETESKTGVAGVLEDLGSVETVTYPFININGAYQALMQRDYIYDVDPVNDVVRNRLGQLTSTGSPSSKKKVKAAAEQLVKTSDRMKAMGVPLVYLQAPSKLSVTDEEPMPGVTNFTYPKVERFLKTIGKGGVDYIDARKLIRRPIKEAFYKTDHHWTVETAFEITTDAMKYLRDNYGVKVEEQALDEDNYETEMHEDVFLGAEARRTGKYYNGLDDFAVIKPKFDTDFDVEIDSIENGHISRSGSYEEAIIDHTKDLEHYTFEDSTYCAYLGGDAPRMLIENKKAKNDARIMIIKDSYGMPPAAFITNMVKTTDVIDLRYYDEEKSVWELIDETQPDAVIFIYGPGYLAKKYMFNFN